MIRSRVAVFAMLPLAATLASCNGTAEGLASATGKVVCDGQPAAGAVLYFHRQAGDPAPPPSAAGVIPSATAGDDGTFTVDSGSLGRGIAPGKYNVMVQWPEAADLNATASKTKSATVQGRKVVVAKRDKLGAVSSDRLKGRYADSAKPQLKAAEIKPGSNDLGTLEVSLK